MLKNWDEIKEEVGGANIILGNGFSRNIWEGFNYPSLFQIAYPEEEQNPQRNLFDTFGTNFESVMHNLHIASKVNEILNNGEPNYQEIYDEIKDSLLAAVHSVHIQYAQIDADKLAAISNSMTQYKRIYTTNYDLILYWSLINYRNYKQNFCDFFWSEGNSFDPFNTDLFYTNRTHLYFLHGGLHLYKDQHGVEHKITNNGENILTNFGSHPPLFVCEGQSNQKLREIKKSNYLSFCLENLQKIDGPLVVLGQSFSDQDNHIVDAINRCNHSIPKLAIGLHNGDTDFEIKKRFWLNKLNRIDEEKVMFFRSNTHPLTISALNCNEEE